MVVPNARSVSIRSPIFCTMMGANPSLGSSSSNRPGLPINARPMVSNCCSPPDSWPPIRPLSCASSGSISYTRSMFHSLAPSTPFLVAISRLSCTLRSGKICRSSGTKPTPARATTCGGRPRISRPASRMLPERGDTMPAMAFMVVLLPAPLRPSSASVWPLPTASAIPNNT
ncbi:hypothetical protein SDC9_202016 [bioreactor metagenome]|uniref:Uncharacterized protein n=1 Tax=bioreactor metagenome TaxID=1076179 RepID=A0A645IT65_9ZZZZ